jgi:hypothetical protein
MVSVQVSNAAASFRSAVFNLSILLNFTKWLSPKMQHHLEVLFLILASS